MIDDPEALADELRKAAHGFRYPITGNQIAPLLERAAKEIELLNTMFYGSEAIRKVQFDRLTNEIAILNGHVVQQADELAEAHARIAELEK